MAWTCGIEVAQAVVDDDATVDVEAHGARELGAGPDPGRDDDEVGRQRRAVVEDDVCRARRRWKRAAPRRAGRGRAGRRRLGRRGTGPHRRRRRAGGPSGSPAGARRSPRRRGRAGPAPPRARAGRRRARLRWRRTRPPRPCGRSRRPCGRRRRPSASTAPGPGAPAYNPSVGGTKLVLPVARTSSSQSTTRSAPSDADDRGAGRHVDGGDAGPGHDVDVPRGPPAVGLEAGVARGDAAGDDGREEHPVVGGVRLLADDRDGETRRARGRGGGSPRRTRAPAMPLPTTRTCLRVRVMRRPPGGRRTP